MENEYNQIGMDRYFYQVQALSEVDSRELPAVATTANGDTAVVSYFPYLLIGFFFVSFIGVYLISGLRKIAELKQAVSLALLLAAIPAALAVAGQTANLASKASPDKEPVNLQLKMQDESKLVMTFETRALVNSGYLLSLDQEHKQIIAIEFDTTTKKTGHLFEIENINPSDQYYLMIFTDGKWFGQNGQPINFSPKEAWGQQE